MKWITLAVLGLCAVCAAQGQARVNADAPATSEKRAREAAAQIATGPWVRGDWALRMVLMSGKGREKVSVPVELVGGWTPQTGRWQRVKLPNGRQWLVKGKPVPQVWELGGEKPLSEEERMNNVSDRVPMSWEMFTLSFLGWKEGTYKGVEKMRARWCDVMELTGRSGAWAKATVWLDTEFGAPLEAEIYDAEGRLLKTVRAVSIKKAAEGEWVVKRWEVVDGITGNKVVVETEAIATGGRWDGNLADERSAKNWPSVPAEAWRSWE